MKNYLLLFLSLLLCHCINVQANSAICFLTHKPPSELIQFAEELAHDAAQYDVDVFIMVDDNNFNLSNIKLSSNLQFLQISKQECILHGYRQTIYLPRAPAEVTSWDKALLYFCVLNKNYSFLWLIENDVFIPSVQAFRSLHQLYSNTSDFVVPRNELNLLGNTSYWLWTVAVGKFVPPWSHSMVNVVGLSQRMLMAINDFVMWRGAVPYHEYFFHALAMKLNLIMVVPPELSTIVYRANISFEHIRQQPNNLWHPIKDLKKQITWRQRLAYESSKQNNTIQLTDLETLCDSEIKMINFLNHFEIRKSHLSPNIRLSMQQRFFHLGEQCQKRNASREVVLLAMKLADHAYKLPENPVPTLVRKKSSNHLRLEKALEENKEAILELLSNASNSSLVRQLRQQATSLIKELTTEIKREFEEELRNPIQPSSSTTTTTPTVRLSPRLPPSMKTTPEKKRTTFFILTRQINYSNLDLSKKNMQINSLLFFIFCLLFVFLWWNDVRERKYFVMMFIYLLFVFCWYNM